MGVSRTSDNREKQKAEERAFAETAASFLEEPWQLTPNECPDFDVDGPDGRFGLEVTNCFAGDVRKGGSSAVASARYRQAKLHTLRSELVAAWPSIRFWRLDYMAEWLSDENVKLNIVRAIKHELNVKEERDIVGERQDEDEILPFGVPIVWINPITQPTLGPHWRYMKDYASPLEVSSVSLQRAIDSKADRVDVYRRRHSDVRLLVTADSMRTSGHVSFEPGYPPEMRGFDKVYFLLFPKLVIEFPSGKQASPYNHTLETLAARPDRNFDVDHMFRAWD